MIKLYGLIIVFIIKIRGNWMKKALLIVAMWMFVGMTALAAEAEEGEMYAAESVAAVKNISVLSEITCHLEDSTIYSYTGKAIKPVVSSVSYIDENGNFIEKMPEEFLVEKYKNNVKIGMGDIEISINGYEGTVVVQDAFKIRLGEVEDFKTSPYSYKKIKVTWDEVPGASGYSVYRSKEAGVRGSRIRNVTDGDITTYYNTSVKLGTTYYYTIRPYVYINGKKTFGEYSEQLKQRAQVANGKVTEVKRNTYNSVKVKWKKIYGATGYILYRSTEKDGDYTKIKALKGGSVLSYIDRDCVCGERYYYKVKAYRRVNGVSHYGNQSPEPLDARTTPGKGAFTSETYSGITSVKLCWKKSDGATGYKIYRSTDPDSGYEMVYKIEDGEVLTYTDEGLDDSVVYYYKLRPYVEFEGEEVHGLYSSKYKKNVRTEDIEELKKYVYVKYVSGGETTSGWDCSGFSKWAINFLFNKQIARTAEEQSKGGIYVDKDDMSTWEPGDLLFYEANGKINHVAVYLGNGLVMHALNSKYNTIIQDVEYYESWDKKNTLVKVRRYR